MTRLKRERLARGIPAWKLAAQANVHPMYVSQYERGLMAALPTHQARLARALGLRPEELFDAKGFAVAVDEVPEKAASYI
ncbi:MAG: helix-turn-helix transcriptional regulator [Bacillota bacterium]